MPEEFDGTFVSNEFPTFDYDAHVVAPEFLANYFRFPNVWAAIAAGSKGLGDRRQRVHPEQVLNHELWLPPMDVQRNIVLVHDSIGGVRLHAQHSDDDVDALLPALLDRAFRGEL